MKRRHKVSRRKARKARRHYAVLGYLAEHGPCPADEIAKELRLGLGGLVVDLAVERTIWHRVETEWAKPTLTEMFYDPEIGGHKPKQPRRLYRLTTADERKAKR